MGGDNRPFKYTRDHVQPKTWGPHRTNSSTVACCNECNQKKGHMDPIRFVKTYLPGRMKHIKWEEIGYV